MEIVEYAKRGSIEVIVGPMYAGKSEELIRRVNRAKIADLVVLAFKPSIDDRYKKDMITTHSGKELECYVVKDTSEIKKYIEEREFDVLAIDEVQFFGDEIVDICEKAAENGKRVIVSGLDMDFRGEPFGVTPYLMAIAEHVTKLTAICKVCKIPATRTQRLVNDKPAKYTDPVILVGAKESYEARCRQCHIINKN
ncbi:MAG: thymidine kinase [Clostridiales bacterium]|nr:thymidine kinase [Clostridiales bacterium]